MLSSDRPYSSAPVLRRSLVCGALLWGFFAASAAQANFAIAGEWYANRGFAFNFPAGQSHLPCPPAAVLPIVYDEGPVAAGNQVDAPCARHQTQNLGAVALGLAPGTVVRAVGTTAIAPTPANQARAVKGLFRVPPNIFTHAGGGEVIPFPSNPVVQQMSTSFVFSGPVAGRVATPSGGVDQLPVVPASTRVFQSAAFGKPGQGNRFLGVFNFTENTAVLGVTRRVSYTPNPSGFGGTMGMFLNGSAKEYLVANIIPSQPGNEVAVSHLSDFAGAAGATNRVGLGYETTQMNMGAGADVYLSYNIPGPCVAAFPPSPVGCDEITGLAAAAFVVTPPTTTNHGFPWTTGHVSVFVKGSLALAPQTSTLTARGADSTDGGLNGIRTIQLVAGGVSHRSTAIFGLRRQSHLDVLTLQVPEVGSSVALVAALAAIGGLAHMRRRLFAVPR